MATSVVVGGEIGMWAAPGFRERTHPQHKERGGARRPMRTKSRVALKTKFLCTTKEEIALYKLNDATSKNKDCWWGICQVFRMGEFFFSWKRYM